MKQVWCILCAMVFVVLLRAEEDKYLITAHRTAQNEQSVTEKTIVITKQELQEKGVTTVADALKLVPSMFVPQYGSFGASSFRLNGASPRNVLVMIDGIPLTDPSGIDRAFTMSNMNIPGVERIEVIEGAQSAVHGSNATSGVVNIITAMNKENVTAEISTGSFGYYGAKLTMMKKFGTFGTAASLGYSHVRGYDLAPQGNEKDGHYGTSFMIKAFGDITDALHTEAGFRFFHDVLDYDDWGTFEAVDGTLIQDARRSIFYFSSLYDTGSGYTIDARLDYSTTTREHFNNNEKTDTYEGNNITMSLKGTMRFFDYLAAYIGVDYREEHSSMSLQYGQSLPEKEMGTKEFYAGFFMTPFEGPSVKLNLSGAGRLVIPSPESFDSHFIYKAGIGIESDTYPNKVGVKLQYGTGYNLPSLYQLYGLAKGSDFSNWPNVTTYIYTAGNYNLKPETSKTLDASVYSHLVDSRIKLTASLGKSWYDDYIKTLYAPFTYEVRYANIDTAEISYYELQADVTVIRSNKVNAGINARYNKTVPLSTTGDVHTHLPQVPFYRHVTGVFGTYGTLRADLEAETIGDRRAGYPDIILKPYTLVNTSASWQATEALKITVVARNILNLKYEHETIVVSSPYGPMETISSCDGPVSYPGYETEPFNFKFSFTYSFGNN